jgi:hypothetical protein
VIDKLPELRRAAAFAAHAEGSAEALRALHKVAAESLAHDSSLASIDDAIADAKNRVLIARAMERDVADRASLKAFDPNRPIREADIATIR